MAMIDEKGRLFGKVNLLDLVVVLAIVAVVGRFGLKAAMGREAAPVGEDKAIQVTLRFGAVAQPTVDYVKPGLELFDSKSNTYMGKVVRVSTKPAVVVTNSEDGRVYEHLSKDRFDHYVVVEGPGRVAPNGVTLNGLEIKIGRTNFVKAQLWAGYGVTWEIDLNPKS